MTGLIVPNNYKRSKDNRTVTARVQIRPASSPDEFIWLCASCKNPNMQLKIDVSDNHAFSCHQCGYTWTIGIIPDDIRHFLKDIGKGSDVRHQPTITIARR